MKINILNSREFIKIVRGHYSEVVAELMANKDAFRATKYISPTLVVRATRRYKSERGRVEMVLSITTPNYLEREFIKLCKKAKERFPVQNVQLKFRKKKKIN